MNLQAPRLALTYQESTISELLQEQLWDSVHVTHIGVQQTSIEQAAIHYSLIQQSNFADARLLTLDLMDSRFENCDFSNATIHFSGIHRVQFINCKFVGTRFINCTLKHAYFEQCILTLASFEGCKMETSIYHFCTMNQLDLYNCQLKHIDFSASQLHQARFEQTSLATTSLASSFFDTLLIEAADLKGCTLSTEQALYFAERLLQVTIE